MNWKVVKTVEIYDTLIDWWKDWDFPIVELSSLPPNVFVAYNQNNLLYIVPIYETNSDICWLGFPTSNKKAKIHEKVGVLEHLIDVIEIAMKSLGFRILMTTSGTNKIMNIMENKGYKGDTQINQYLKQL